MKMFNAMKISRKLPLIMVLLTVLSVMATGIMSYVSAKRIIENESGSRLAAISESKSNAIARFFENIDRDLRQRASDPTVAEAITAFSEAYAGIANPEQELQRIYIEENPHPLGEKDKMVSAGVGIVYDWVHARHHEHFDAIQNANGYYDIFLFDAEGNLVYTVFKELDYATNMNTGRWKDTDLAEVFRRAMKAGPDEPSVFEDFEPYEPSYGAPASFMARPVFDETGKRIGVLAYQMPIGAINAATTELVGLGESGDSYLVGDDYLLRTDSLETEENDILATKIENESIATALGGDVAHGVYPDQMGDLGLWYVRPIEFLGTTWAMVTKQDAEEVFAPLAQLRKSFLIKGGILVSITIALALLLGRNITTPLTAVGRAMTTVADGSYDVAVPATERGDEIGGIAKTLDTFRQSLKDAECIAREAAFKGAGFEVCGAPLIMTDTEFTIIHMNAALLNMMRERKEDFRTVVKDFDPETLMGKSMDAFHVVPGKARAVLSRPENLPHKLKIRVGDAYLGLLVDAVRDREGELIGYVLEWKDQTYQMHTQVVLEAIDRGQSRLEMKLDGTVKHTNDTFCETFQTEESALRGGNGMAMVKSALREADLAQAWASVVDGKTVFDIFEIEVDGCDRLIRGSLSPLPDHQGKTDGFLLLGSDVTEQQAAMVEAEARQEAMAAAQARVVETLRMHLDRLANGELTARIETSFDEENDRIRADFNHAMDALLAAMREVADNADMIRGKALEISSAADNLSNRTESQAATLEETAAALDQLTASVKSAAAGANDAAKIVVEARANAEQSGEVVREAVSAMGQIENSSREISKIIGVIDDIAFQTNLLALNAGVEAARAGDAGRGFAVVASEVRALAQRSSEAAREISTLITSSGGQVKRGVDLVGEAGESLKRIVASVSNIADHVGGIAQSSAEQSTGLAEINSAMNQLDQVTQQNAAMVEETTATSHMLTDEAQALMGTIARFKISDGTPVVRHEPDAPRKAMPAAKVVGSTAVTPEALEPEDDDGWSEF